MEITTLVVGAIIGVFIGGILVWFVLKKKQEKYAFKVVKDAQEESQNILKQAKVEAENIKKEKIYQAKEKFLELKSEHEKLILSKEKKISEAEKRIKDKESQVSNELAQTKKLNEELEQKNQECAHRMSLVDKKQEEVDRLHKSQVKQLEVISGLTAEEAKSQLVDSLKNEAKTDAMAYIQTTIEEAKLTARQEARKIIINTIQRIGTEEAIDNCVSVFNLESDDVKGRIIGREGRNIRTLETLTGVDLIIDDTPEAVILSGYDPIRREIAKTAIKSLIDDGRIHPSKIEEAVDKARKNIDQVIRDAGEQATFDLGIHNMHPDLVKIVGKLKYRTSYGQNGLQHSMEVAYISGLIAAELDLDVATARRAGLLHDIGKALDHEVEGSHVEIGVALALKYKENAIVVNAIASHHGDTEPTHPISVIVATADALSASRPGARRESLENYIKRLQKLEEIANEHKGVEKTFAIQAGREIRVIVNPEEVDDTKTYKIAKEVKNKIEETMQYPGNIKVNVIREVRAVKVAR